MHRGGALRTRSAPLQPPEQRESSMADKPTPEQLNARLAKSPFNSWLGLTVTSVGEDTIEMAAKWREEWVVNPAGGYTHGGILAALRRSPLVGADLDLARPHLEGRSVEL